MDKKKILGQSGRHRKAKPDEGQWLSAPKHTSETPEES